MRFPILIPSKGRPDCLTALSVPHAQIVVEPQDFDIYAERHGQEKLILLPANNQGIAYVRNFIVELMRSKGVRWFWMMDDDIPCFFTRTTSKTLKINWLTIERNLNPILMQTTNEIGQASLEYSVFASLGENPPVRYNGYCDCVVAINTMATEGLSYRKEVELKEDRDFTMQILNKGLQTWRFTRFSFRPAASMGKQAGGLKDVYEQYGKVMKSCQKMVDIWGPEVCTIIQKPDRIDLKINWKHFKRG